MRPLHSRTQLDHCTQQALNIGRREKQERGKQTSQAPLEEKVCFPKGLLLGQKRVFFFFLLETNTTLQTKHIPIKIKERKIEKVIFFFLKNLLLWP